MGITENNAGKKKTEHISYEIIVSEKVNTTTPPSKVVITRRKFTILHGSLHFFMTGQPSYTYPHHRLIKKRIDGVMRRISKERQH